MTALESRYRVVSKPVPQLSEVEFRAAEAANLGSAGLMRGKLRSLRSRPLKESRAIMLWDGQILAAWALRFKDLDRWELHLWTTPAYRRRGLATWLASRARQGSVLPIGVHPDDFVSERFYRPLLDSGKAIAL